MPRSFWDWDPLFSSSYTRSLSIFTSLPAIKSQNQCILVSYQLWTRVIRYKHSLCLSLLHTLVIFVGQYLPIYGRFHIVSEIVSFPSAYPSQCTNSEFGDYCTTLSFWFLQQHAMERSSHPRARQNTSFCPNRRNPPCTHPKRMAYQKQTVARHRRSWSCPERSVELVSMSLRLKIFSQILGQSNKMFVSTNDLLVDRLWGLSNQLRTLH